MLTSVRQLARVLSAWGLPYAVVLSALCFIATETQLGSSVNQIFFDRLVAFESRLVKLDSHVLLAYTDDQIDSRPEEYLPLIERALALDAAAVGIAEIDLSSWSDAQIERLSSLDKVVIGTVNNGERPSGMPHGSVRLVNSSDGVYRQAWGRMGKHLQSFASSLVATAVPDQPLPSGRFGVRFRGGPESLPHVLARSLRDGLLTEALVRERIVLIGPRPSPLEAGMTTPTTGAQRMTVLAFHGHAVNSLIAQRWIRELSPNTTHFLFFGVSLLFLMMGRRVRLHRGYLLLLGAWVVQACLAFVVLWRLNYSIPIVSVAALQLVSALISIDQRMRFSDRAWQMMRRRGFSVSPRYKTQPYISPESAPWDEVAQMFQQLFAVDGIAVLVRRGERERLKLATTLGYAREQVVERRRDIRRSPYAEAIERKTAIKMPENRNFFEAASGQVEFVVPLFHGGRLKGIVIVEISTKAVEKKPGLINQLTKVGDEIAPWLARFQQLSNEATDQSRWWNRIGSHQESETFRKLTHHMRAFERRLHQSYAVIENSTSGRAAFSLGGEALTINATMFRIMHQHGVNSPNASLVTVIRTLTRRPLTECREIIRRALVEGRQERVVSRGRTGENPLIILIQPLAKSKQTANAPEDMFAFEAEGIQLEVFEANLFGDVRNVKEHVTEQALSTVDDVLADVVASAVDAQAPLTQEDFQLLEAGIDQARDTIQRCQSLLSNSESEDIDVELPVDLIDVVEASMTETRPLVEQHHASVTSSIPTGLPDVSANPHRLRQAISIVIQVLVEHARENSVIHLAARQDAKHVELTLENEGCGVALDRLAGIRRSQKERPDDASRLLEIQDWLEAWGGTLDIESDLGEGALVRLTLRSFNWNRRNTQRPRQGSSAGGES